MFRARDDGTRRLAESGLVRSGRYCLVKSRVTFWPPMPKEFEIAALTWHWIFFVNVPIGIAAAMLGIGWSTPTPALVSVEGPT